MSPSVEFTSQNTKCPRNSRKTKLKDGSHCLKMDALKDPPHAFYSTGESYLRGVCSHEHMIYNESQHGVHYAEHQVPKELEENQVKRWLNKVRSHCLKMDALKDPPHAFYSTGESYLRGVCSHEHMVSQDVGDSLLGVTEGSGGRADA
ncbi:ATP phosphoribosyltransferase regulatory subunit [Dissostichus eleginoides]|uniref:ATP phosphoribosyltransferase regulatory subunit n=1 Tax=Dissostichus eleginoides TaxID=100907 RepID=A0AAD9BAI3_DISEL|nr:ATP phosphoribosyltransferase regulatory subunit [Dissostichus eleginoides]